MKAGKKCVFLILVIIVLDQATKVWVHFNMPLGGVGQIRLIGDWLKLYHVLNPGMAFGIQFGFAYGKFILTIGRIIASILIGFYIHSLSKKSKNCTILVIAWSFVLGGAIGNVIDSAFYGVLFGNAPMTAITPWMHGQVIDMVYIDLWTFKMPLWMPFFPGQYVRAFPIFNLADVAITLGVILILLNNKFKTTKTTKTTKVSK